MHRLRSILRGPLAPGVTLLACALAVLPLAPLLGGLATGSVVAPVALGDGGGEAVAAPQLVALPLGVEAPTERTTSSGPSRIDGGPLAAIGEGEAERSRGTRVLRGATDERASFVVSGAERCRQHGVYRL